jgi:hypothetical protein
MAEELLGMLTGALVPVAAQWSRYDDETQRRLRNTKYDLRDLRDAFTDSQAWGGVVRSRLPIVMDWDTGLAIATAQQPVAQKIPTLPSLAQRPDLCQGAESFVSSMQWPPRPGMYDSRQNVTQVGELSTTSLACTYEEVRAAILGFVSCNGSTAAGRVQLYRAINALNDTAQAQNMSKAEYAARWAQLFGVPTSTIDPHRDPSKSPTIGSINAGNNVASVVWVGTGSNNEINAQTDAGHRIRGRQHRPQYGYRRDHVCHALPIQASRRVDRADGSADPYDRTVQPVRTRQLHRVCLANTRTHPSR